MKVSVIQFPGSNCDYDATHALINVSQVSSELLWHKNNSIGDADAIIIPGGFSFGDYLRCGAIARFSPIMTAVQEFAENGGRVLGICNGFQVLCECGLLPGCLIRNTCLEFRCQNTPLSVNNSTPTFNQEKIGKEITIPIAHGEGNYRIDESGLKELEDNNQVLFRYINNPNGSIADIAGIRNKTGNVFGMMPHPERAVESFHPTQQGQKILEAFINS